MLLHIITGQTATGKTAKALQLAKEIDGEIINVDSRQIYQGLDIISGKDIEPGAFFHPVTQLEGFTVGYYQSDKKESVPVWLYDAAKINQTCTAYDFRQLAQYVTADIWRRGKTPLLVGGSYFYLSSFLYDIESYHIPPDVALRQELDEKSVEELQRILASFHRRWLNEMNESDRMNPRRLIRKIEIASHAATPFPSASQPKDMPYSLYLKDISVYWHTFFHPNSVVLRESIEKRVRDRMKQGALKEYRSLLGCFADQAAPGYSTIGCRQLQSFSDGIMTEEEVVADWTLREVQYAKRQKTFMKRDPHLN